MIIAESQLKQLVYEEVMLRVIDDLIDEELFRFCLENSLLKESEIDDIKDEWNKSQSFRQKVRNAIEGFDALPTKQRILGLVAMGILGAGGAQFVGDYAEKSQASAIAQDLRAKAKEARAEYTVDWKELSNFRAAAGASAEVSPLEATDTEGINKAKDEFAKMGMDEAPIIASQAVGIVTGTQKFLYTPAKQIPDNEILPFVGMSKSDWEKVVRTWLQDEGGQDRLKAWTGSGGKATSAFWEYAAKGGYVLTADPEGEQGMWLPPEWSVAYDVLQKNVSRAGYNKPAENPLTIPMDQGDQWLEEIIRKSLHNILDVL